MRSGGCSLTTTVGADNSLIDARLVFEVHSSLIQRDALSLPGTLESILIRISV